MRLISMAMWAAFFSPISAYAVKIDEAAVKTIPVAPIASPASDFPVAMAMDRKNCALELRAKDDDKKRPSARLIFYDNGALDFDRPLVEAEYSRGLEDLVIQMDNNWYAGSLPDIAQYISPNGDPAKLSAPTLSISMHQEFLDDFPKAKALTLWDDQKAQEQFDLKKVKGSARKKWLKCIATMQKSVDYTGSLEASFGQRRLSPSLKARPTNNPATWVTPNDYPTYALANEMDGTTGFSLSISLNGRVKNCNITRSSGYEPLDQATCKYINRRARFTPAADNKSRPMTSEFKSSVRWVIPE